MKGRLCGDSKEDGNSFSLFCSMCYLGIGVCVNDLLLRFATCWWTTSGYYKVCKNGPLPKEYVLYMYTTEMAMGVLLSLSLSVCRGSSLLLKYSLHGREVLRIGGIHNLSQKSFCIELVSFDVATRTFLLTGSQLCTMKF